MPRDWYETIPNADEREMYELVRVKFAAPGRHGPFLPRRSGQPRWMLRQEVPRLVLFRLRETLCVRAEGRGLQQG
jgi:hypothetical protein